MDPVKASIHSAQTGKSTRLTRNHREKESECRFISADIKEGCDKSFLYIFFKPVKRKRAKTKQF